LKVSTNVKIAMQCFQNFGGSKCHPPWLRAWWYSYHSLGTTALPYLYWHYKLVLQLAGVFGFLQMSLLLNRFADPWFILCVKKHEWKRIATNKARFCNQCSLQRCANAQYHQTVCTKSHLTQFSTFRNIVKARKQGEAIWIKWYFVCIFIRFCTYSKNSYSL